MVEGYGGTVEQDRSARPNETAKRRKSRFELLKDFSALTAPLFTDGRTANGLIEELYDGETGLPKGCQT